MKINPKVSIIIAYHRKKKYFKKALNSILSQTYKKYEIILIYDDKNFDELQYVKKLLKKFSNKKLIVNKNILGPGLSRNKGISLARGKYIAFCDADDLWKKNKLETQISFMEKNKLNFSHSSYLIIDKNDKKIGKFNISSKIKFKNLIRSCDIGLSTVILKKHLIKNKTKFCKLKTKEDYFLWLQIIKKEKYLYGISKYLGSWRYLEDSLSSSLKQKLIDAFRLYNMYERYNSFISFLYVIRLSFYAFLKKIKIWKTSL